METKTKKEKTLYDVRRKHQREQKRKKSKRDIRELLIRLAFSRPKPTASPLCRLVQKAAAGAVGCMIVKAQARIMTAVANRVLSKLNKNKA